MSTALFWLGWIVAAFLVTALASRLLPRMFEGEDNVGPAVMVFLWPFVLLGVLVAAVWVGADWLLRFALPRKPKPDPVLDAAKQEVDALAPDDPSGS